MVKIKIIKNTVKGVFVKENKDYIMSDIVGGLAAMVTAVATSYGLSKLGVGSELNSIFTYACQCAAGIGVTTATYSYYHKKEEDPVGVETRKHALALMKVGSKASTIAGIAKLTLHYLLLKSHLLPAQIATPIAYTLPTMFSSYYRHRTNFKNGILCINGNNTPDEKPKPECLDDVINS